jgi:CheY-like chemotaxis protein/HPt (histidine-containing phosphotransfer) domain-containing protein
MNFDIDWPASAVAQAQALENRRARSFLIVLATTIVIGIVFLVYSRTTLVASATLCLCSVMFYRQFRTGQDSRRATIAARGTVAIENAIVSRASFDIRNALMAILGYCDLPLENTSGPEDRIASIRSQAIQIVAALDRVVDVSEAAGPNPRSSTTGAATAAPQRPARVLLAEDDPHLLQTIKFYLQSSGAEVTVVADGQLAYKQAMRACEQQKPFDLILMDVQMPKFDGCESTIKLRNAGYLHPIIALTANATDQEQRRCMAAGCNGFLAKPTDQAELLQTVGRFMHASASASGLSGSAAEAAASVSPQIAAVRESFRADVPARIAEIADAVFAGDLKRVSALAHRLKGTAGCYGFTALCESAGDLQAAADRGESSDTIQQCLKTLSQQSHPAIPAEAA